MSKFPRPHRLLHAPLALGITTILGLGNACAQDTTAAEAAPTAKNPVTLDSMTVTATKRVTSVQKTPMAITSISAEAITDSGTASVRDVAAHVPGLSVQDNGPGAARLSMRGIYSTGEATTSVYYDEIPISGSVGFSSDAGGRSPELAFYDVERIEALRGPQGTLYGSGSMGGSLRVIFNKPKLDTTEGDVQAGYATTKGGDPSWNTSLMINAPIATDVLAMRLVASKSRTGGYVDNARYGEKNVDESDKESARLMFRLQPTENLTLDASFIAQNTDAIMSGWSPRYGREYETVSGTNVPYEDHTRISNLTLNWDLGWATLTAASSYFDSEAVYGSDFTYLYENTYSKTYGQSALDVSPVQISTPSWTRNWSNEVRLASNGGGQFDWTAGVFNENRRSTIYNQHMRADAGSGYLLSPRTMLYKRVIYDQLKQNAIFGEGTWHATDRLDVTAGLRYYDYDKTVSGFTALPNLVTNAGSTTTAFSSVGSSEKGWLKKLNVSYQFTPDLMGYAVVADGMRPGGANQNLPDVADNLRSYRSDSLWNYEAGVKSSWFDHRLFVNAAIYQIDWKDMQVSTTTNPAVTGASYNFLTNAGAARMRGTEWELVYRPAAGLDLGATINYVDAKLVEDQENNNIQPSSALGKAGDRVPFVARWTAALYGSYRWSLGSSLDGMVRLDYNYVGTSYTTFNEGDSSRATIGNYALLNTRFGVESASGKWGAYFYVNNLLDKVAITNASNATSYYPYGYVISSRPRTIGIDLDYKF